MTKMNYYIERAKGPIEYRDELSEEMIWSNHGTAIWKAHRFIGRPVFYPVYKYQNYYSFSPLSLILLKGSLRLNHRVDRRVSRPDFVYYSGTDTIDIEITRIGGPPNPGFVIKEANEYARRIAEALYKDTSAVEAAHPGFTNIILCGGKDSLNLLLLPWRNPVIVASAPPNYDLVKVFIADNGLNFDVICLEDDDDSLLRLEILVNCCRNNLEHCRWGPHLEKLSQIFNRKAIFWLGQMGAILRPFWKTYTHPPDVITKQISRICTVFGGHGKHKMKHLLDKSTFTQRFFFRSLWHRSAMWQGAHQSIIRQLTDCLVLSGYHGQAVQKILSQVDLLNAVQKDIRPLVGKYLHGGPVLYPSTNPGPPTSEIRKSISHLTPFLKALTSIGIPLYTK